MSVQLLRCAGCFKLLPLLDFNRNRSRPTGRDTRCRECNRTKNKAWFLENRAKRRVINAAAESKRRSASRKRVPWYDSQAVRCIYAQAAARRAAGEDVHVDHIVPLRSKLVCGLHVQTNLRLIGAGPNRVKGNRLWPDMPDLSHFCKDSETVLASAHLGGWSPQTPQSTHQ